MNIIDQFNVIALVIMMYLKEVHIEQSGSEVSRANGRAEREVSQISGEMDGDWYRYIANESGECVQGGDGMLRLRP